MTPDPTGVPHGQSDPKDPSGTRRDFSDEVRNATARAEDELQRLIRYINDEVVPDVRRQSSSALRTAADSLHRLARKMDDRRP